MTRKVLIVAAVVVLVAGGGALAVRYAPDRHGERVDGPTADYPTAIGDRAPEQPTVPLPGTTEEVFDGSPILIEDPIILDGLRISGDDDIIAHELRTGAKFWTYRRDETQPYDMAVTDTALFVLWNDGLLVRFDPRSAEVVWRREIGDRPDSRNLVTVGTTVAVIPRGPSDPFRGYDAGDGDKRWETPQPIRRGAHDPTCRRPQDITVAGGVLAIRAGCDHTPTRGVVAVDGESGEIRWQHEDIPANDVLRIDDTRVATVGGERITVYAVRDGRRIDTTAIPHDAERLVGPGKSLVMQHVHASPLPDEYSDVTPGSTALAGWSVSASERTWTVQTDGTWRIESIPYVTDGLGYVVQRHFDGPRHEFTLVVYDITTGAERSRSNIPIPDEVRAKHPDDGFTVRVHEAAAGVVSLRVSPRTARPQDDPEYPRVLLAQDEQR